MQIIKLINWKVQVNDDLGESRYEWGSDKKGTRNNVGSRMQSRRRKLLKSFDSIASLIKLIALLKAKTSQRIF